MMLREFCFNRLGVGRLAPGIDCTGLAGHVQLPIATRMRGLERIHPYFELARCRTGETARQTGRFRSEQELFGTFSHSCMALENQHPKVEEMSHQCEGVEIKSFSSLFSFHRDCLQCLVSALSFVFVLLSLSLSFSSSFLQSIYQSLRPLLVCPVCPFIHFYSPSAWLPPRSKGPKLRQNCILLPHREYGIGGQLPKAVVAPVLSLPSSPFIPFFRVPSFFDLLHCRMLARWIIYLLIYRPLIFRHICTRRLQLPVALSALMLKRYI